MDLQYGEIVSVKDGRATVRLAGYEADAAIDMVLLQPGGGSSVKTWLAPQPGDCVAVLLNAERLDESCVVGGVYTDAQRAPKSGGVAAIQASYVYIGSSMEGIQKASRDDHVQAELAKIKAALDALTASYNAHVHTVPVLTVTAASPTPELPTRIGVTVTGPTATGTPQHEQTYKVGDTAADSVYVK
jgi:phage baseplate assembly protein gpV